MQKCTKNYQVLAHCQIVLETAYRKVHNKLREHGFLEYEAQLSMLISRMYMEGLYSSRPAPVRNKYKDYDILAKCETILYTAEIEVNQQLRENGVAEYATELYKIISQMSTEGLIACNPKYSPKRDTLG